MTTEELLWMLRNNCGVSKAAVDAAHQAADRIEELEDKLAEAVDFVRRTIRHAGNSGDDFLADKARAILAELTGGQG